MFYTGKAKGDLSVQEAASPFALMKTIFAGTSGESLSSDAYRQNILNILTRVDILCSETNLFKGGKEDDMPMP